MGGFWRQKALERDGMITGPGMADKATQNTADTASITAARGLFAAYCDAITRLDGALGMPFSAAVDLVMKAGGHVVVCGMGKSGLIGRKIAATLASTGTPSLFCILPRPSMAILAWYVAAMWWC